MDLLSTLRFSDPKSLRFEDRIEPFLICFGQLRLARYSQADVSTNDVSTLAPIYILSDRRRGHHHT